MKKLFELNEKDLEIISGGDIRETAVDIILGAILGIPGGAPVICHENIPTHALVVCGATSAVSSVILMGIGAGALKAGQVLYKHFKDKKVRQII